MELTLQFTTWTTLITISLLHSSNLLAEANSRGTYTAAVVEYMPVAGNLGPQLPERVLKLNADAFVDFIRKAKSYNADLVVFPEYGLTSLHIPADRIGVRSYLLPVPEVGENPCLMINSNMVLRQLSCAAMTNKIYVVVNLGEIQISNSNLESKCGQSKRICHFNTNVVFDRSGTIIAKYHKYNLYFEDQFDAPLKPEYVTFATDFGVTFGTFICFDLMFKHPAVELVRMGVKNFVTTTAWVDEIPFLTAPQANTMWAMSANANLLVAGYHEPSRGALGSGIFSGVAGPLNYTFDPHSGSRLVVSEVPVMPHIQPTFQAPLSEYIPPTAFSVLKEDLQNYSSVLLRPRNDSSSVHACHNHLCCDLKYQFAGSEKFTEENGVYALVAFTGFRKTGNKTAEFGWEVCGVIRSENFQTMKEETEFVPKFVKFKLSARGMRVKHSMAPSLNTLDSQFQPISHNHFKFAKYKTNAQVTSSLLKNVDVRTIAVINRIY